MIKDQVIQVYRTVRDWVQAREAMDRNAELTGAVLSRLVRSRSSIAALSEVEFRVYSQFGDDGIIQWLTGKLPALPRRFIEFGVEDYTEANTRFLMVNDHWEGLVLDGAARNMRRLRNRKWFWRHALTATHAFLTRENVDGILASWAGEQPVGLLHIDVDGNDYWLWEAIHCIEPGIVIMEYNGVFGSERAITIPYQADFNRRAAHHSGQYAGASLGALAYLADRKGYALVGTNSAGNNAYFVRLDLVGGDLRALSASQAYTAPVFRESRDAGGRLNFHSLAERQASIRGLPVWDVVAARVEPF
jgi:hypothetical protein